MPEASSQRADDRSAGVHRPARAAVAGVELVLAVACALAAWWAWQHGTTAVPVGESVSVPRVLGDRVALSVGAAAAGGLLLLDVPRQLALAWRVRS
ncbi:hypothetical protein [Salinifilum ghardaiensis]